MVDCFSDPGLRRIRCGAVFHRGEVMVYVSNASRIVYPLVRSERRHIGLHTWVLRRNSCLPVCGFACALDLDAVSKDCSSHARWKHPIAVHENILWVRLILTVMYYVALYVWWSLLYDTVEAVLQNKFFWGVLKTIGLPLLQPKLFSLSASSTTTILQLCFMFNLLNYICGWIL